MTDAIIVLDMQMTQRTESTPKNVQSILAQCDRRVPFTFDQLHRTLKYAKNVEYKCTAQIHAQVQADTYKCNSVYVQK